MFFIAIATHVLSSSSACGFVSNVKGDDYAITKNIRMAMPFTTFDEADAVTQEFNIKCYAILQS
jgi:hypothetical protein